MIRVIKMKKEELEILVDELQRERRDRKIKDEVNRRVKIKWIARCGMVWSSILAVLTGFGTWAASNTDAFYAAIKAFIDVTRGGPNV